MERKEYNTPKAITTFVEIVEVILIGVKNFILKFGDAILQIGRIVVGFAMSTFSIVGMLGVLVAFFWLMLEYYGALEFIPFDIQEISGSSLRDFILMISGAILLILPLILVLSLGFLLLFKTSILNKKLGLGLGAIWILAGLSFGFSMAFTVPEFVEEGEIIRQKQISLPEGQLHVQLNQRHFKNYEAVHIQLFETSEDQIVIEERVSAQGRSPKLAEKNAESCSLVYAMKDSVLEIDRNLIIDEGQVFRAQRALLRIGIPSGTAFTMNRKAFYDANDCHEFWTDYGAYHSYHQYSPGPYYIEGDKLKMLSEQGKVERTSIELRGKLMVELGDEEGPTVLFREGNAADLRLDQNEEGIMLTKESVDGDSLPCALVLNTRGAFQALVEEDARIYLPDFDRENCRLVLKGGDADIELASVQNLEILADSRSSITLNGEAEHIRIELEDETLLDYIGLDCPSVEIVKKSD